MKVSMNEATALNCQAMSIEQDILLAEKPPKKSVVARNKNQRKRNSKNRENQAFRKMPQDSAKLYRQNVYLTVIRKIRLST